MKPRPLHLLREILQRLREISWKLTEILARMEWIATRAGRHPETIDLADWEPTEKGPPSPMREGPSDPSP